MEPGKAGQDGDIFKSCQGWGPCRGQDFAQAQGEVPVQFRIQGTGSYPAQYLWPEVLGEGICHFFWMDGHRAVVCTKIIFPIAQVWRGQLFEVAHNLGNTFYPGGHNRKKISEDCLAVVPRCHWCGREQSPAFPIRKLEAPILQFTGNGTDQPIAIAQHEQPGIAVKMFDPPQRDPFRIPFVPAPQGGTVEK